MDIGEFESVLRNQRSILQNQIIYLNFDVVHMLESTINEVKNAEFSQVPRLSEDRRKFVDDKILNLNKSTDIKDVIILIVYREKIVEKNFFRRIQ